MSHDFNQQNLNHSSKQHQNHSTHKIVSRHSYGTYVRVSVKDDIDVIINNLREADFDELCALDSTPRDALNYGFSHSDYIFTGCDAKDKPIIIFGCGSIQNQGYIWALATKDIYENKLAFVKASKKWVYDLTRPYMTTFNVVAVKNTHAVQWLKYCGAKFIRKIDINNNDFYEFIIITKNV
jgi:hypothetical protein